MSIARLREMHESEQGRLRNLLLPTYLHTAIHKFIVNDISTQVLKTWSSVQVLSLKFLAIILFVVIANFDEYKLSCKWKKVGEKDQNAVYKSIIHFLTIRALRE